MPFTVTGSNVQNTVTLQVAGDVDLATAPNLREAGNAALQDPSTLALLLDISSVGFMDSTGLGVLVGLRNMAETGGKKLALLRPSPVVSRLFALSGLTTVFDITD